MVLNVLLGTTNIDKTTGIEIASMDNEKIENPLNPLLVAPTECPNSTNLTVELRLHSGVVAYESTFVQTRSPYERQVVRWKIVAIFRAILGLSLAEIIVRKLIEAPMVITFVMTVTIKPSTSDTPPGVRP